MGRGRGGWEGGNWACQQISCHCAQTFLPDQAGQHSQDFFLSRLYFQQEKKNGECHSAICSIFMLVESLCKEAVNYRWGRVQTVLPTRWPSTKNCINYDKWIHLKARNMKGLPWHVLIIPVEKAKAWEVLSTWPNKIWHNTRCIPFLYLYLLKLTANITSCFTCFNTKIKNGLFTLLLILNAWSSLATPHRSFGISFDPQICSLALEGGLTHANQCGSL